MARKRYKPEEIVSLLRQAEVLHGQGTSMADAIRQLGISEVTIYRWHREYAGMSGDQLRRLKGLEKENERLRRAVSDLTLDKQILKAERMHATGPSAAPNSAPQATETGPSVAERRLLHSAARRAGGPRLVLRLRPSPDA